MSARVCSAARGRSIRLSTEGHTLLVYADRLLRLADEAVSQMRTGKPKGTFRLGSLESTAGSRLAPIMSRYHGLYPDVVVELATGTTGALITRVMNFDVEAALYRSHSRRPTSTPGRCSKSSWSSSHPGPYARSPVRRISDAQH